MMIFNDFAGFKTVFCFFLWFGLYRNHRFLTRGGPPPVYTPGCIDVLLLLLQYLQQQNTLI